MPSQSGTALPPATQPPDCVRTALPLCTRDALLLVDANAALRWCNPALESLLGQCLTHLLGLPWLDALPVSPADRAALEEVVERIDDKE